jgi:cardiolipin synthase C
VRGIPSFVVMALAAFVGACASLPPPEDRVASTAFSDTLQTRLGRAIAPGSEANRGSTGVHALVRPQDAFAARLLLAAAADRSLDVQYYIWHDDQAGWLLLDALWRAAERGVRVRLLLDDLNTEPLDPSLGAVDAHPNIEVRLYNPFVQRKARLLAFAADFARLNRRMHNKSFTADNQASIVGGRNIGNEYLGGGSGVLFVDLDVLVAGAAVAEVSKEFDLYWNSASAYPAAKFAPAIEGSDRALQARFANAHIDKRSTEYLQSLHSTTLVQELLDGRLPLEWTIARLVYDDPAKTLDRAERVDILLFPELVQSIGRPERSLDLVSPYFVPGEDGTAALVEAARRGVRVRILTNSLAASDVSAVHAGYAKRRHALLAAGVRLFELKPTATRESDDDRRRFGSSSSSALHAKTFGVDGRRIFVGSFNFDQRSMRLNTEMGLVVDSPVLAGRLATFLDTEAERLAYEVRLDPGGRLYWSEQTPTGERRFDTEPGTTWFKRARVEMMSILPIEWLL